MLPQNGASEGHPPNHPQRRIRAWAGICAANAAVLAFEGYGESLFAPPENTVWQTSAGARGVKWVEDTGDVRPDCACVGRIGLTTGGHSRPADSVHTPA